MSDDISIGDLISQFKFKKKEDKKEPELSEADQWFKDFGNWLTNDYEEMIHSARAPGLHASSLGSVCGRRNLLIAIYGMRNVPHSVGNHLTFDVGHMMHYWWQERYLGPKQELWGDWVCMACPCEVCGPILSAQPDLTRDEKVAIFKACKGCQKTGRKVTRGFMPLKCECGTRWQDSVRYMELQVINKELKYVGHTDGVLKPAERVFEFKSMSPSEHDKLLKRNGSYTNGPKYDHVVQAHAYMGPLDLEEALIVYVNKGSQCKWSVNKLGQFVAGKPKAEPFIIKFDEKIWNPIVDRIAVHHESIDILENLKGKDDRPSREVASKMPRPCENAKCEMAQRCPVSRECFSLD